jgi:pimeloyl-ACP methyl ester carboxylesterase
MKPPADTPAHCALAPQHWALPRTPRNQRTLRWCALLAAATLGTALLASCSPRTQASTSAQPAISFTDCRIKDFQDMARCATVSVPEDAAVPTGKRIDIFVAVLPALTPRPEADPVFIFAGGPGQAASDLGRLAGTMQSIRKSRDIVLVDQRGTGKSKTLSCDLSANASNKDPFIEAFNPDPKALEKDWARCIATLQGNPALHRTDDYIADLERVRQGLGLDKINVWGGSYGSRVALRYMKLHPQSIRTVVLDGVAPTSLRLPDDALLHSEAALQAALAACTAQPSCAKAYPGIAQTLDQLLTQLRSAPQPITLPHPATGRTVTGMVTDRTVVSMLWPLLYQPEAMRLMPTLIHAAAQGQYAPLAATLSGQPGNSEDAISLTQRFAVMCAEDMLGRSAPAYARFQALSEMFYSLCKSYPHGQVAPEFFEPTTSSIPTLLLSGGLDPVTPPSSGTLAASTLARSKHITVGGLGHIVSPHSCVRRIMAKFIDTGDIAAAQDTCEADLALPSPLFYVNALEAHP